MNYLECPDYLNLTRKAQELTATYPFIKRSVIGKSVAGRNISAFQIGRGEEYVLYAGAFHGSEWLTATLLFKFMEDLAAALADSGQVAGVDARRALMARGLIIVPVVNPDGVEISLHGASGSGQFVADIYRISDGDFTHYNANARGVDINHNFDAGWQKLHKLEQSAGIYGPAPRRYGGTKPESEPETAAIVNLCRDYSICHAVAYHSQGEVIYWDYGQYTLPKSIKMAGVMARSSGYQLDAPEGIAVGGGFKDWFIKKYSRPAFTVEIGKGENPLNPDNFPEIYRQIAEMMMFTIML